MERGWCFTHGNIKSEDHELYGWKTQKPSSKIFPLLDFFTSTVAVFVSMENDVGSGGDINELIFPNNSLAPKTTLLARSSVFISQQGTFQAQT